MSAYRFCRTDDIALLVDAWNRCGEPPMTAADLKREIRELGLWCSSCMVAFDGDVPVGVLMGCKRPPRTLVRRIAVHPEHRRRGHARHMLTSLSAKLAILGPKELVVEVPAGDARALALFEACGWTIARRYVDRVLHASLGRAAAPGLIEDVPAAELAEDLFPANGEPRSWQRTRETLAERLPRMSGSLIVSAERVEAAVLYTREEDRIAVWAARGGAPLETLLRDLCAREGMDVLISATDETEIVADGFQRGTEVLELRGEAKGA